jgi:hypothetical protein
VNLCMHACAFDIRAYIFVKPLFIVSGPVCLGDLSVTVVLDLFVKDRVTPDHRDVNTFSSILYFTDLLYSTCTWIHG